MLDYKFFKEYYNMFAIDLRKQQTFDTYPKKIQQINFTGNLSEEKDADTAVFFILEEKKKTKLSFSDGNVKVLSVYFYLIYY